MKQYLQNMNIGIQFRIKKFVDLNKVHNPGSILFHLGHAEYRADKPHLIVFHMDQQDIGAMYLKKPCFAQVRAANDICHRSVWFQNRSTQLQYSSIYIYIL